MTHSDTTRIADLLQHAPFVRGLARALLGRADGADDVEQETWSAALERPPAERGQDRAWLGSVVRKTAAMRWRSAARRRDRETRASKTGAAAPSTLEVLAQEEVRRSLLDALLALDEPYREVLLLRYYEALSPREVAARLRVPVETVRTRIKRGLKKLRTRLDAQTKGGREAWVGALMPLVPHPAAAVSVGAVPSVLSNASILVLLGAFLAGGALLLSELGATQRKPKPSMDGAAPQPVLIGRGEPVRAERMDDAAATGSIVGTVHRDGAPLPGFEITLRGGANASVVSDAQGRFEFEGVSTGEHTLEVRRVPPPPSPGGGYARLTRAVLLAKNVVLRAPGQRLGVRLVVPVSAPWRKLSIRGFGGVPWRGRVWIPIPGDAGARVVATQLSAGEYRVSSLPPDARRVVVTRTDGVQASARLPLENPGAITIWGEMRIWRGRVIDAAGLPVPGARLRATPQDASSGTIFASATADARGFVTLTTFEGGLVHVVEPTHAALVEPWNPEVEVLRIEERVRVQGRVVGPSGESVGSGMTVVVVREGAELSHRVTARVATDEEGRFQTSVPPGRIAVYAVGTPGATPLEGWDRDAAPPGAKMARAGNVLTFDVKLDPTASLQGRVVDRDGRPIAGALVESRHEHGSHRHRAVRVPVSVVASGEDGRFVLRGLMPGFPARVIVSHPDHATAESAAIELAPGDTAQVDVTMRPRREMRVRLVQADTQEPVSGIHVTFVSKNTSGWGYGISGPRATTDAAGWAIVRDAPYGDLAARFSQRGTSEWDAHPLDVEPSATFAEVTLELDPRRDMRVQVRLPAGVASESVRVRIEPRDAQASWNVIQPRPPEGDGTITFEGLPRLAYVVTAEAHHVGRWLIGRAVVEPGASWQVTLDLVPRDEEGQWILRLRDPKHAPLHARVQMVARHANGSWTIEQQALRSWAGLATYEATPWAKEIYFRVLPGRTPEGWRFGGAWLGPMAPRGGTFDVPLEASRRVEGRLLGAGGAPLGGVRVEADPFPESAPRPVAASSRAMTDAEGRFVLEGLPTTRCRVHVHTGGPEPITLPLEPTQDRPVLRLPETGPRITLQAVDTAGRPALRAHVAVHLPEGTSGIARPVAVARTDARGQVQLAGLEDRGDYTVVVSVWGDAPARGVVRDWRPAATKVVLEPLVAVQGRVRDTHENLLRGVQVYARDPFGAWQPLQEKPTMPWRGHVPAGRIELLARPLHLGRPEKDAKGTWVQAGDTNLILRVDPGPSFRFRVSPWKNGDVAHGEAWIRGDSSPRRRVRIERNGTGELLGVDVGQSYTLLVRYGEDPLRPSHYVYGASMHAGAWFELQAREGTTLRGRLVGGGFDAKTMRGWAVHEDLAIPVRVAVDGTFTVTGLPEGEWALHVTHATSGKELLRARLDEGQDNRVLMR